MKKMFLLLSHPLSEAQIKEAKAKLHVEEFVSLPQELKDVWGNIPATATNLKPTLSTMHQYLKEHCSSGDIVFVQGDAGATYMMVNYSLELGLVPLYATTKRESVEAVIDGKVQKTNIFEHILFREYGV